MSQRVSVRKPNVSDDDDADELLYQTALLLGENPKPLKKLQNGKRTPARPITVFVLDIFKTILTPSTLKVVNMHIGDKLTTFHMIPSWFQPNDHETAVKDIVCPDDVTDKHPYETVACYRAAIGKSNNFNRLPLDVSDRSTETLMLSLDAFAKQFGGQLNFTNQDLSFENSTEQMACGIANMGSVHLLATDSLPTAVFNFKVGLDYKKDLARTPDTMANFITNFSTAVAKTLGCENNYVRVFSVEKSSEFRTSSVKVGLTIPDPNETKRLADNLQVCRLSYIVAHFLILDYGSIGIEKR
jgi:hypothetical protein